MRNPVLIACVVLFFIGVAIAGVGVAGEVSTDTTPTEPAHGQASQDMAAAMAVLHPGGTPDYLPVGVLCISDVLSARWSYENAATGGTLFFGINIANTGEAMCDLPVISGFKLLDQSGNIFVDKVVEPSESCNSHLPFCVAKYPIPLEPSKTPVDIHNRASMSNGTAFVNFMYKTWCEESSPDRVCERRKLAEAIIVFNDGMQLSATFDGAGQPNILSDHVAVVTAERVD